MTPQPDYIPHRVAMFEKLKREHEEFVAKQPRRPIKITMPDGGVRDGTAWETTPMEIAKAISSSLAQRVVISKVEDQLWDLLRPLEGDCRLQLLDFEHPDGRYVFWHSSAHILGEACERHYGCHLCMGPPTEDGFYYEMSMKETVTDADQSLLETLSKQVIKERQPFERLVVTKENLLEMFKHNPYKQHIIKDKIPDGTSTTVYRCGPLIDLCRGPHVPDTGRIKAFAITKHSSSYWLGNSQNESLQRVYGVSFPSAKELTEYKKFLEEAAKRDHRRIGKDQELFFFNELSPGSCFFLPHGARIYSTLVDFIKTEYRKRGFTEVVTPNIYNVKLWETSGHWQNYKENMFSFDVEKEQFALKPMNCPGHCVMFAHRTRSHRELPLRLADFGVLHRNEYSGALTGLTRVRRFQQDDAHIFCRPDQLEQEMSGCLSFLKDVYGIFGFTFSLKLSTRPEKYLGALETWNEAEKRLEDALNRSGFKWELNPGDGAFYGPKIDITIKDALNRRHQCATIQLDFQLPQRFNLSFVDPHAAPAAEGGAATPSRPIIIHRAILGSVERMIAILTENFAGKWPFWLSPRQVCVVPVGPPWYPYAESIQKQLHDAGIWAEADVGENTLPKKIRNAEISQFNFIFVVGQEELDTGTVNIRNRDAEVKGKSDIIALDKAIKAMLRLKTEKRNDNKLIFE